MHDVDVQQKQIITIIILSCLLGSGIILLDENANTGILRDSVKLKALNPQNQMADFAVDLYLPNSTSGNSSFPLVIMVHGVAVSKEFFANYAIELAEQGMIVVCPELWGHGISEGNLIGMNNQPTFFHTISLPNISQFLDQINVTLQYMKNSYPVNQDRIGLVGHSLGGGIVLQANLAFPNTFHSTVAIAPLPVAGLNRTNIANFCMIHGELDEVFSLKEEQILFLSTLEDPTQFISGETIGNFSLGTARLFTTILADHATEFVTLATMQLTIDWTCKALLTEFYPQTSNDSFPTQMLVRLVLSGAVILLGFVLVIVSLGFISQKKQDDRYIFRDKEKINESITKKDLLTALFCIILFIPLFFLLAHLRSLVTVTFLAQILSLLSLPSLLSLLRLPKFFKKREEERRSKLERKKNRISEIHDYSSGIALGLLLLMILHKSLGMFFLRMIPSTSRFFLTCFSVFCIGIFLDLENKWLFRQEANNRQVGSRILFLLLLIVILGMLQFPFMEGRFPLLLLVLAFALHFTMIVFQLIWRFFNISPRKGNIMLSIIISSIIVSLSPMVIN